MPATDVLHQRSQLAGRRILNKQLNLLDNPWQKSYCTTTPLSPENKENRQEEYMEMMRQKPPNQEKTTAKNVIHKDFPSQPSVIARLMGIDTIPAVPATMDAVMIHAEETSNLEIPSTTEMISVNSPRSATFRQSKCSLISYRGSRSGDYRHCLKKMRPRRGCSSRQHHPQEELLHKIREDFQSWQTSKTLENARTVAGSGCSRRPIEEGRYIQMLAQENLHKEKMAKYGYGSCRISMEDKDTLKKKVTDNSDSESTSTEAAAKSHKSGDNKAIKVLRVSHYETMADEVRDSEDEQNNSSTSAKPRSPARIVILKPSTCDVGSSDQETLFSSSRVKRDGNMEEFVEEVKERLKKKLKLKSKSEVVRRSWGNTDPKQVARDIAKQIRETVSMQDIGKGLYSRSESFRAFRSDRKHNAVSRNASPEHVRLKSVISRSETNHVSNDSSPPKTRSRGRIMSLTDIPDLPVSVSVPGSGLDDQSCTGECKFNVVSPRALVRSLSAPASGISGGRLFAEEDSGRHANSDAVSEGAAVTLVVTSEKSSSSFSLRGTVSNLRQSLRSRANKLFGKKMMHWSKKPSLGEFHPHKMLPSPPGNCSPLAVAQASSCMSRSKQENFTELPPSPVSPLEVKGSCTLQVAELSPQSWSEFEAPRRSNGSSCRTNTTESYPDMAYIKQVLIAAGLYEESSTICDDAVFHEVEEAYAYACSEARMEGHHRMLFDLANEALEMVVGSVKPGWSLRRWVVDSTGARERKLLDDVWHQVQSLRNPPVQEMQTVEIMVAREAQKSTWIQSLHEDAYVLGMKVERAIFDQLLADILHELFVSQIVAV
uniref:DUF4378 domain-containing protein n=2 Tax=Oryza brachyantha TaxID=4533 RepID=J3MHU4_ORYBR